MQPLWPHGHLELLRFGCRAYEDPHRRRQPAYPPSASPLGHEDWDVCAEAEDGVQAVNRAKQFKPDLIILDLAMPELNGIEAARQISKALPGVPILMLTLYATPLVEKEAEKVGVQRVISKSTSYMLVSAIEEAFAQVHHEKAA